MLRRIQRLLRAGPDRDAQRLPAGENDSAAFARKLEIADVAAVAALLRIDIGGTEIGRTAGVNPEQGAFLPVGIILSGTAAAVDIAVQLPAPQSLQTCLL